VPSSFRGQKDRRNNPSPRPFLALEVGPRLPYTYPQCVPGNRRHANRSMKQPSEAKRHLGQSLRLSSSHRPLSRKLILRRSPLCTHRHADRSAPHNNPPTRAKGNQPSDNLAPEPRPRITHPPPPFRLGQLRASEALPLRRNHGQGQWPAATWRTPCPVRRPALLADASTRYPPRNPAPPSPHPKPRVTRRAGRVPLRRRQKCLPLFSRIRKGVEQWKKLPEQPKTRRSRTRYPRSHTNTRNS
jgi:hypothetical protein